MTPIRDEFDDWLDREAAQLRHEWESPGLWPRIRDSLELERRRPRALGSWRTWALVAAMLAFILAPLSWWRWKPSPPNPDSVLLTDRALSEVQKAEAAYARSIEQLSRLAAPRVQNPPSALIGAYREKLLVLDSAIADLAAEAERNPYNHYIRRELLALYHEKQQTLEGILHEQANRAQ